MEEALENDMLLVLRDGTLLGDKEQLRKTCPKNSRNRSGSSLPRGRALSARLFTLLGLDRTANHCSPLLDV